MNNEKIIYYSKISCYLHALFFLVFVLIFTFVDIEILNKSKFWSIEFSICILLTLAALYSCYDFLKRAINNKPQIIINQVGIETTSIKLHKWEDIKNEKVITMRVGKGEKSYLVYDYPNGSEKVLIQYLDTDDKSLNRWLAFFRDKHQL